MRNTIASNHRGHDRRGAPGPRRFGAARYLIAFLAMLVSVGSMALVGAPAASAATLRTWTGAGANALWTNPANWGGTKPVAGDDLVFPTGAARRTNTNDFGAGTAFHSLRFTGSANVYVISGNQVTLGSGGISTDAEGMVAPKVTLSLPIRLGANERFAYGDFGSSQASFTYSGAINLAGFNLTLGANGDSQGTHRLTGALTGTGNLYTSSSNWLASVVLAGTNTSTGTTIVGANSALYVDGDYASRPVTVNSGAVLHGSGKVGALSALTGSLVKLHRPTTTTAILNVAGNLALRTGSKYSVVVKGITPGTGYGQAQVSGTVSLGATLEVTGAWRPVAGQAFTLIANQASAAVTGTFAGLPEGALVTNNDPSSGASFRITYKGGTSGRDVLLTAVSTGVSRTWTGAGTTNVWTNPANWSGGVAPRAGDDLIFPAGAAQTTNVNNFAADTRFHSLAFTGDNAVYDVSGYTVLLGAGGIQIPGSGSNVYLGTTIHLDANVSSGIGPWSQLTLAVADLAGRTLKVQGAGDLSVGYLGGGGVLDTQMAGKVFLQGESTDAGGSIHVGGSGAFYLLGKYALRPVTVDGEAGSVLTTGINGATVGALTVNSGIVELDRTVEVHGKLSLAAGTLFHSIFHGGASDSAGQLSVFGPVSLGGATLRVNSGFFTPGKPTTLIRNNGSQPVSGTFAGLPEGARVVNAGDSSWTYTISYQGGASGRDVVLTAYNIGLGPEADLAVTQTASPDPVARGDRAHFTMEVANYGPVATRATLRGRVPAGTTLVSLDHIAGWSCRTGLGDQGRSFACTRDGDLEAGATARLSLVVRVGSDAGDTLTNRVAVSGDVTDPSLANNTSEATIAVAGAAAA